jgi:hypothetical protein
VEVVVVAAGDDGVSVGGGGECKLIEDGLVLYHFAEFGLEAFVEHDGVDWFLGAADVPQFNC